MAACKDDLPSIDGFLALAAGQAAVRRFRPDPIDDALLTRVLEAARWAPSLRNTQPWRFVVVQDPATRRTLGALYAAAYETVGQPLEATDVLHREAAYLARHLDAAPVLLVVGLDREAATSADPAARYASIFPAVQNLCLAARAAGLGTVITTVARRRQAEIRELLGIPDSVEVVAVVPVGWPAAGFARLSRRPLAAVTFADRWGVPRQAGSSSQVVGRSAGQE